MTVEQKYQTVLDKDTFYFYNQDFQENYESYVTSLKETLLFLKHQIDTQGLKQELFEHLLAEKEHGLRVLLALTGFTNESLKRLITIVRVTENKELGQLLFKDRWNVTEETQNIKEWSDKRLESMIKNNEFFRKGIVNLFFAGATVPFLSQTLPLFEFKKLSLY